MEAKKFHTVWTKNGGKFRSQKVSHQLDQKRGQVIALPRK